MIGFFLKIGTLIKILNDTLHPLIPKASLLEYIFLFICPTKKPHQSTYSPPMKMYLLFLFMLAMYGCDALPFSDDSPGEVQTVIRSGESFGFCAGYCWHELELDGTTVTFKALPGLGGPQPAERLYEEELDQELWNDILKALDASAVRQLDEVVGCPDCADGGAEWLEIEDASGTKRVTFEYGKGPDEIKALVDQLRTVRDELKKQVGTAR